MRTLSIEIAFSDNRFGVVATTRCTTVTSKGCERKQDVERGKRGEGREINFVVLWMFAARAAYATWLTSFHELKVSASRLRIKISRGLLPCSLDRERESRGNRLAREKRGIQGGKKKKKRGQRARRKS